MRESGLDRHDWEGEMQALEDQLGEDPAESLPELDVLVARMLGETGYDLIDPVTREGEREVVSEFHAAHEITGAVERGSAGISHGDVAAAVNGYRAVFDFLIAEHGTGGVETST